jgi:hypothetical protein
MAQCTSQSTVISTRRDDLASASSAALTATSLVDHALSSSDISQATEQVAVSNLALATVLLASSVVGLFTATLACADSVCTIAAVLAGWVSDDNGTGAC